MIKIKQKGNLNNTVKYFTKIKKPINTNILEKYGKEGVAALSASTPLDTGKTASSWYYTIKQTNDRTCIMFNNSNINKGVPIAIILQYGHGTGTGGWVEGIDYINPAVKPLFEKIAEEAWKEVTKI